MRERERMNERERERESESDTRTANAVDVGRRSRIFDQCRNSSNSRVIVLNRQRERQNTRER